MKPKRKPMARRYVRHAITMSWLYAVGGAGIILMDPGTPNGIALVPIFAAALSTGYVYWLYDAALKRAGAGGGMGAQDAQKAAGAASASRSMEYLEPIGLLWRRALAGDQLTLSEVERIDAARQQKGGSGTSVWWLRDGIEPF